MVAATLCPRTLWNLPLVVVGLDAVYLPVGDALIHCHGFQYGIGTYVAMVYRSNHSLSIRSVVG